jgi:heme/copper-type cytochrome/quinol oxidase subunit 2
MKCKRQIVWKGKVETITHIHSYAWSGKIPCTGKYRCIYCGKIHSTMKNGVIVTGSKPPSKKMISDVLSS